MANFEADPGRQGGSTDKTDSDESNSRPDTYGSSGGPHHMTFPRGPSGGYHSEHNQGKQDQESQQSSGDENNGN